MAGKRFGLAVLLAVSLAAAAFALRGRGRLPDKPEDAVKAFFLAAQDGDAATYLSLLAAPLKTSFESTQSQLGAAAYRDSLRASVAGLKSFAVVSTGEPANEPAVDRAAFDVELVFADRSERQRIVLERQPRGWAIAAIERADVEKPAEKYGAAVYDFGPAEEGKP